MCREHAERDANEDCHHDGKSDQGQMIEGQGAQFLQEDGALLLWCHVAV